MIWNIDRCRVATTTVAGRRAEFSPRPYLICYPTAGITSTYLPSTKTNKSTSRTYRRAVPEALTPSSHRVRQSRLSGMLLSRISAPQLSNPTQEDIFASSISSLFTDDTQNSHGTPGHSVIYTSPTYGDIKLGIPQHPDVEEGRKLFAHYLWNAGVIAADAIEVASSSDGTYPATIGESKVKWDRKYWNIRGRDLLELGAGT